MNPHPSRRAKVVEWIRRYLPNELAGWAGEIAGGALVYWLTGSLAAAVIAGTVGSSVGYYATAYANSVRWAYGALGGRPWPTRAALANARALRSIAVEFGPAEALDSIVLRPAALFAGPYLFGNLAVGWVVGSVAADVAFYALAIVSYERFSAVVKPVGPTRGTAEHDAAVATV